MRIEDYAYGRIVVDGREETNDIIITGDELHPGWWRDEGHSLKLEDLDTVLEASPSRLIVGTGTQGNMQPEPGLLDTLRDEHGMEVEVLGSEEAVQRWNELGEKDDAALAIHLTC